MELHHYLWTLSGGLMVGIAAGLVLIANGRAAGVSGMVSSALRPRAADAAWQVTFLLGLVAGGALLSWLDPAALPVGQVAPIQLMVGAGLLVGFGARLDVNRNVRQLRHGRPSCHAGGLRANLRDGVASQAGLL